MSIIAPKSGSKFEPVPSGNHVARLYRIIHIGTVTEAYQGEDKQSNKIMLSFELPNETKVFKEEKGEEPLVISREYTLSMAPKANLRKFIEGMIGTALHDGEAESFDIAELIGKPCMLNVVHKVSKATGNPYAMIAGAAPIPKGLIVPVQKNASRVLDYVNWNQELFDSLSEFHKEKIRSSEEYKKKFAPVGDGIDSIDVGF